MEVFDLIHNISATEQIWSTLCSVWIQTQFKIQSFTGVASCIITRLNDGFSWIVGEHRILIIIFSVYRLFSRQLPARTSGGTQVHQIEPSVSTAARLPHEQDQLSVYAITSRRWGTRLEEEEGVRALGSSGAAVEELSSSCIIELISVGTLWFQWLSTEHTAAWPPGSTSLPQTAKVITRKRFLCNPLQYNPHNARWLTLLPRGPHNVTTLVWVICRRWTWKRFYSISSWPRTLGSKK